MVISCDELDIIKQFSDLVDPSHTLIKFRINPHKENLFFLTNYKKEYRITKYDTNVGSTIFKEVVKTSLCKFLLVTQCPICLLVTVLESMKNKR